MFLYVVHYGQQYLQQYLKDIKKKQKVQELLLMEWNLCIVE